jgi:hypothetical protein
MISKFAPSELMLDETDACAPAPTAVNAMTDAMPITMPSIVKPDRTLLTVTAL